VSGITPPRRLPCGETPRGQILDVATAVFLEYGYAGATLDLVAARAGASKGTIVSFFDGKEGLFNALIEERADCVLARLRSFEILDADVPRALANAARRYMDVVMSPKAIGLHRLILAKGPRVRNVAASFHRIGQERVAVRVADALRCWAERGLVRVEDPGRIATQFLEVVRGELYLRVMAGVPPKDLAQAIDDNIESAVRIFWRVLRPVSGAVTRLPAADDLTRGPVQ
jgi:AcrR family transcriptional regulator